MDVVVDVAIGEDRDLHGCEYCRRLRTGMPGDLVTVSPVVSIRARQPKRAGVSHQEAALSVSAWPPPFDGTEGMAILAEQAGTTEAAMSRLMAELAPSPDHLREAHRTAWEIGADDDSVHGALSWRAERTAAAKARLLAAVVDGIPDAAAVRTGQEIAAEMEIAAAAAPGRAAVDILIGGPCGPPVWIPASEADGLSEPQAMFAAHAERLGAEWPLADPEGWEARHEARAMMCAEDIAAVAAGEPVDSDDWEEAKDSLQGRQPRRGWRDRWAASRETAMATATADLTAKTTGLSAPSILMSSPDLAQIVACHARLARLTVLADRLAVCERQPEAAHALLAAWQEMESAHLFRPVSIAAAWMGSDLESQRQGTVG